MSRLKRGFAMSLAAIVATTTLAGAAHATPGGTFTFTNKSSVRVTRKANSFKSGKVKFPEYIDAGATAYGEATAPDGTTTYSGTTIWKDDTTGYGCSFTVAVSYNRLSQKYLISITAAKEGGDNSTAVCSITSSKDTSTGEWSAYPVIESI